MSVYSLAAENPRAEQTRHQLIFLSLRDIIAPL